MCPHRAWPVDGGAGAEALGALDVTLTAGELAAIEAAVPADAVAGTRYDAFQMSILDSERT